MLAGDKEDRLLDEFGRRLHRGDADANRIAEDRIGQVRDGFRHRGGEQERLSPRRQLGNDAANVGHESHVEHPVGFVQHENLDGAQVDESLVHQVKQPAGRGNEDIDALLQGPRLSVLADAAEDHRLPNRRVATIRPKALADLGGQLPRGREDQDANRPASSLRSAAWLASIGAGWEGRTPPSCPCRSVRSPAGRARQGHGESPGIGSELGWCNLRHQRRAEGARRAQVLETS